MLRYRDKFAIEIYRSILGSKKTLERTKDPFLPFFLLKSQTNTNRTNNSLLSKNAGEPPPPRFRCIISRARRRIVEFHPARKRAKEKR